MAKHLQYETVSEILSYVATRRNVRAFRRDEIPSRHLVRLILNAAASAPYVSHDGKPPWRFIATDDRGLIGSIAHALDPGDSGEPDHTTPDSPDFNSLTYFKNAPMVVVMLSKLPDPESAPEHLRDSISYEMTVSFGAALGILSCAMHMAGLGAGIVGSFTASPSKRADAVERLLGIKSPWRVHSIVSVGFPAEKGEKIEADFDDIVEFR